MNKKKENKGKANESTDKLLNRRGLLVKGIATLGTLGVASLNPARAQSCQLTPVQPEGPFYPILPQDDTNFDLTKVQGKLRSAKGEVVVLKGIVKDNSCVPIKGALVEIWQACESGKYNHSSDPNEAPLDPNFQYWGRVVTNEKGEYSFKTIKPGAYPANNTWVRPPHIHLKVSLRGFAEIITQVYFKENTRLNTEDLILKRLSASERDNVIIDFKSTEGSVRTGVFDITLNSF